MYAWACSPGLRIVAGGCSTKDDDTMWPKMQMILCTDLISRSDESATNTSGKVVDLERNESEIPLY